jgi:probable rRNA maturation factor|tara:strand:- start:310 stop:771 length:462 start_codon:yes stop_codon:yes gene_type:complete
MIQINYNVDESEWSKNFPHYKKCISKTVSETLDVVDTGITQNIMITFFLTSNKNIKELNLKYRKKDKATNVLSFPMQSFYMDNYLLGDIALANQIILKEAIELKITKYDYLCKMTIHGMLHLLGYDHKTEKQYKQMKKFENLIYNSLKLKYDK